MLDNEDSYYNVVSAITAMPIDFMVQLDDLGIDFTTINAWQLFVLLFENIKQMDKYVLSLVFGDMDLSDFEIGISPQNGKFVIRDEKHDITIDRAIHSQMASVLRKLHHLEKNHRRPANSDMRTANLAQATQKIVSDFGSSHVMSYRDILPNATADGQASGWAWYDCKVELMSETMVYGTKVWANSGYEVGCINSQFPLFALAPEYIHRRFYYWLRGVGSATYFCLVDSAGVASAYYASYSLGVRPFFFVN